MLYLKQKLHSSTEKMHYIVCIIQVVRLQGYSMIPYDVKKKEKKSVTMEQQLLFLKMHLFKK